MGKHDDLPNITRPGRRRGETRWQRFWRRRRMNAVRNSSDHAVFVAVGLLALVIVLGALLYFALSGADFSDAGPPRGLNPLDR